MTPHSRPNDNLADLTAGCCNVCGDAVDASQTAVAVKLADGTPGLVHPACYPSFSARERAQGNTRFAEAPFRDRQEPPPGPGA